jgi:hypothetical protein
MSYKSLFSKTEHWNIKMVPNDTFLLFRRSVTFTKIVKIRVTFTKIVKIRVTFTKIVKIRVTFTKIVKIRVTL